MTQAQADKALSTLKGNITQWFNTGKLPSGLTPKQQLNQITDDVAQRLGMTADELKQALKDGKTIAQLAQEKGISLDSLTKALSAQRTAKIQQALKDGKITQDQASKMLDNLKKNLTNRLEKGRGGKNVVPQNTPQSTPQPDPAAGA